MTELPVRWKSILIPAAIWEAKELGWMEKCLVSVIYKMDTIFFGCCVTNQQLAVLMGTTTATIGNMLNRLRTKGWIKNGRFNGRTRVIYVIRKRFEK